MRPVATRMSLPSIACSPEAVRTETATSSPERPRTSRISAATMKLNAFRAEDALQFIGNVRILSGHDPGGGFDDGHPAAETAIGLRHFEADIAAADQDHMRRQIIEFERLDMRQRPGRLEAGNVRNCRMRAQVEENPLAGEHARAAVVEVHFERSWVRRNVRSP